MNPVMLQNHAPLEFQSKCETLLLWIEGESVWGAKCVPHTFLCWISVIALFSLQERMSSQKKKKNLIWSITSNVIYCFNAITCGIYCHFFYSKNVEGLYSQLIVAARHLVATTDQTFLRLITDWNVNIGKTHALYSNLICLI